MVVQICQMVAASLIFMYETDINEWRAFLVEPKLHACCTLSSRVSLYFIFDNSSRASLNNLS